MTLRHPKPMIRPPAYHDPRDAELRDRGDALRDKVLELMWRRRVRANEQRRQTEN